MTELYQHRARKRFGQNFLHDAGVIHRILRAIHGRPGERLLEIGPGQGALTKGLLGSGARLDVIELDQDLIPLLRLKFGLNPLFTLHQGDAMKYDLSSIAATCCALISPNWQPAAGSAWSATCPTTSPRR